MAKIVDVHCHVVGSPDMMSEEVRFLFENYLPWEYKLPTPEFLIEQLDKAGVDYAVLQAYDTREVGLDIPNEYIAEVIKKYPNRFICGYASINPVRRGIEESIRVLDEAYAMGLRGLKLHPVDMQFSPNERWLYPLYEKCIQYNIPVGFHIQPAGINICRLKFCDLVPIDELAHDLPELKIQVCHLGKYPMPPDIIDLSFCLMNNQNVYTDISCPMPLSKDGILNTLRLIKQFNIIDKCMFGTDFPVMPQSWWTECINQVDYTEGEKEKVMGTNALRFVGRDDLLG